MFRLLSAVLLAFLLTPHLASAVTLAKGAPAGTVVRVRGEVSAELDGMKRALAEGAVIEMGDRLKTGDGARIEIKFLDGTDLSLGEKADFTIDELSIGDGKGTALFTRTSGALRLIGGTIAKEPEHKIEIASNAGTLGIRGTDVWGGTIKPGSLLDVFLVEGAVYVRTPGGTVELNKPGVGTSVHALGGKPDEPGQWDPALRDRAFATVSFDSP